MSTAWKGKAAKAALLALAVLIPVGAVLLFRLTIYPDGETTNDAFYHVAIADKGPAVFLAKTFPNITISVWNANFSDKELGFHFYLWAVRKLQGLLGLSKDVPFNFPSAMCVLLASAGFVFAAWRMGARPQLVVFGALALSLINMPFLYRLMMVRPHLLAIGLMLLACGLYARGSLRFRCCAAFAVSFVFAWSYSNPHFIVVPALAFGIALLGEFGRKALLLPVCAFAGFAAGLVIHPQFPNSLLIWKVQSVDAVLWPIVMDSSPIDKPAEMYRPGPYWFFLAIPLMAAIYFELMGLLKLKDKLGLAGVPSQFKALALLLGFFCAVALMAARAVEYACPFACLLGVLLAEEVWSGRLPLNLKFSLKPWAVGALALLILGAVGALNWIDLAKKSDVVPLRPCYGMAAWLRCNVPPGSVVANPNWGDFPVLYYSAPEYRAAWGMDPMFSYAFNPRATKALNTMCSPNPPPSSSLLRATTGADYAVVVMKRMAQVMMLSGWTLVYEGPDGWIFSLAK